MPWGWLQSGGAGTKDLYFQIPTEWQMGRYSGYSWPQSPFEEAEK